MFQAFLFSLQLHREAHTSPASSQGLETMIRLPWMKSFECPGALGPVAVCWSGEKGQVSKQPNVREQHLQSLVENQS